VEHVIDRCQRLPIQKTRFFSTEHDGQSEIQVRVYEGNKTQAKDCRPLGTFSISELKPGPAGQLQIPAVFNVDKNGILSILADGGVELPLNKGRLTDREIERLVVEAENYAEADKAVRRVLAARNRLEDYLVRVQRLCEAAQPGVLAPIDEQALSLKCIELCRWLSEEGSLSRNGADYEARLAQLKEDVEPFLTVLRNSDPSMDCEDNY